MPAIGRPRLVLHAGTHKTGTTAIQRVLKEHRRRLSKQGLVYPDARPFLGGSSEAHHRFAHALTGIDPAATAAAGRFIAHVHSRTGPDRVALLSSEAVYRNVHGAKRWRTVEPEQYWARRRRYLEDLAETLDGFDVRILLFLRRPDDFAESFYKESVSKGRREPFEDFLSSTMVLFEYDAQVEALRSAFSDVDVRSYHAAPVLPEFFGALGIDEPPGAVERWERRSPDVRLVLWMLGRDPVDWKQQREFVLSRSGRETFPGPEPATLWGSVQQRDAFLDRFQGRYGREFFPAPPESLPQRARLTETDRERIDAAYRRWSGKRGRLDAVRRVLKRMLAR